MITAKIRSMAGLALPVAFVLIWSSGYLVGTVGAHAGPPLGLLAWRFTIGFAVLAAISLATRAPWPSEPRTWLHLLAIGILLQTVQFGTLYLALGRGVPAGLSSLVISACPLVVGAVAVPLFGERLTGPQWLGLALGLAGVGISLTEKLAGGGEPAGYALVGLALAAFAAGTLYQKAVGLTTDLRTGTTVQLFGAMVTGVPLALLHGGMRLPPTAPAIGSLAWLATVNSIGSFTLLFVLLRTRGGGAATSLLYLVPPVTALLGMPLLGQGAGWSVFAGMAVSGAGVVLVLRAGANRTEEARAAEPPGKEAGARRPREESVRH
ncbi:EamA family transporter [Actinoallomurus sp. NBC_01490]|uniref:DMT family transporter n=1 Tax=Actinoallomurus sp. NBC_01490 TaxID=2903557 RepID=UPI002E340BA9|nr:EamA family transporter [Actinoallomurus sp. NBC_01490]